MVETDPKKTWPKSAYTVLQLAFIEQYFACNLNGTEAVIQAGYDVANRDTAAVIAYENLRKPKIRAAIDQRLNEMAMPANEVLKRLGDFARASMADFLDFDEVGIPFLDLKKAKDRGVLHLIKKLNYDKDGALRSIELHDSRAATVDLGRVHGLFKDRVLLEKPIEDMSDDELRAILDRKS